MGPVTVTPAYFSVGLPPEWAVNTLTTSTLAVVIRTTSFAAVGWAEPVDGTVSHVPVGEFAYARGAFFSDDAGGTWTSETPYGGIGLLAQASVLER